MVKRDVMYVGGTMLDAPPSDARWAMRDVISCYIGLCALGYALCTPMLCLLGLCAT